jgi:hypothetical protein
MKSTLLRVGLTNRRQPKVIPRVCLLLVMACYYFTCSFGLCIARFRTHARLSLDWPTCAAEEEVAFRILTTIVASAYS